MLGCPLDQAFSNNGETTTIIKKKKKKDKGKDIIYENELKPVNDSQMLKQILVLLNKDYKDYLHLIINLHNMKKLIVI